MLPNINRIPNEIRILMVIKANKRGDRSLFTNQELITIKYALKERIRNKLSYFSTYNDEELLRKVRIMLGESMEMAEEDGKRLANEAINKIKLGRMMKDE